MRPGAKRRKGYLASRSVQAAFLIVLVALWYLATSRWHVSPILLPSPVAVLFQLWDIVSTGEFVGDLAVTLRELAAAFGIAVTGGILVGYLVSRSHYRIRVFEPLFAGIYAIPIILFLPLYVLFFGLGPASKIALGATISFFPIALNTIAGFGYVDKAFVAAARSMGASDYQLFRYVLLPAALPVILTGLRIGFTVALLSIIGSETIASLAGLGHRIVHLADAHMLTFGELDGSASARIETIGSEFSGARFEARPSNAILQEMWEKWVFIAASAGITCLMRATIGDIVAAGAADLAAMLFAECAATAAKDGFAPRPAFVERTRTMLTAPNSPLTASMLRDIERGALIEADHILGDLLRRAASTDGSLLQIAYAHAKAYEARRARNRAGIAGAA